MSPQPSSQTAERPEKLKNSLVGPGFELEFAPFRLDAAAGAWTVGSGEPDTAIEVGGVNVESAPVVESTAEAWAEATCFKSGGCRFTRSSPPED